MPASKCIFVPTASSVKMIRSNFAAFPKNGGIVSAKTPFLSRRQSAGGTKSPAALGNFPMGICRTRIIIVDALRKSYVCAKVEVGKFEGRSKQEGKRCRQVA